MVIHQSGDNPGWASGMAAGEAGRALRRRRLWGVAAGLVLAAVAAQADETGVWKTAFVKRGVVGNFDAACAGGTSP